jgi:hypothetical protein
MGYTNQTQHKPSARAKKTLNYYKLYTYETLHKRIITIEIITGEKMYSLWYQHKKTNFPTKSTLDGVVVFLLLL